MNSEVYICNICNSTNLFVKRWIALNNQGFCLTLEEGDECYCEDCQKFTKIKIKENENT